MTKKLPTPQKSRAKGLYETPNWVLSARANPEKLKPINSPGQVLTLFGMFQLETTFPVWTPVAAPHFLANCKALEAGDIVLVRSKHGGRWAACWYVIDKTEAGHITCRPFN